MNFKFDDSEKINIIKRYLNGESVHSICSELPIPRSTLYSWIKKYRNESNKESLKAINLKNFRILENKVKRLEGIIEILKIVDCTASASLKDRLNALENIYKKGKYSIHMLCEALDVSRGTFYNHILRNKRNDSVYAKRRKMLSEKIRKIYDNNNQIFGAKKITAVLKQEGITVSSNMVLELMREMGLVSIRQDSKSMYKKTKQKMTDHVKQNFYTDKPNQVWVSDVTQFNFKSKPYYICVIIDLFSRKVVSYKISLKNSTQLVKSTFKQAYQSRKSGIGLIFHTDRGSAYRSNSFCSYLSSLNIKQSFSRSHVPYDNSVAESFFSSMKRESLYRTVFCSEKHFRKGVTDYIYFYNMKRPHVKLMYKTPNQKEEDFYCNLKDFN